MIVRLILEVDEPLFFLPVDIHGYNNAAGVDLVGFLLIVKLAFGFQFFHREGGKIHQADKFVVSAFVQHFTITQILLICIANRLKIVTLPERHAGELGRKCGMAAVIRPVGIQNTDLRHRGISFFLIPEIVLNMLKITECHGEIQ